MTANDVRAQADWVIREMKSPRRTSAAVAKLHEITDSLDQFALTLERACATCFFAGGVRSMDCDHHTVIAGQKIDAMGRRYCCGLAIEVPITVNGQPFSCPGWQATATEETR